MPNPLLVVVPARAGSKRLPGKNLRALAGKSLLEHTRDALTDAKIDAPVILSTEDELIAAEGERLGWLVPFRRPACLATDEASMVDVLIHALDWFLCEHGRDPENVMLLQPTSPLRGGHSLRVAIGILAARDEIDAVVGVRAINLPPAKIFVKSKNECAEPVSADQFGPVYVPNGAVYLLRVDTFREEQTFYPKHFSPLVMSASESVDVDTPFDWAVANALLAETVVLER